MDENWFWFCVLALSSFRLTRLVVYDTITSFIRRPFLEEVEEENENGEIEYYVVIKGSGLRAWIGKLLSCYWCTGVWVTTILFFMFYYVEFIGKPLLIIFGAAGIAGILEAILKKFIED